MPVADVASPARMSKHAVLCTSWKKNGTSGCNQKKGVRFGQNGREARHIHVVGFNRSSVNRVVEGNFNK